MRHFIIVIVAVAVALGLSPSARAVDNSWCKDKWANSSKDAPYREFMDSCHRLVEGEQLPPDEWRRWQAWQRKSVAKYQPPQPGVQKPMTPASPSPQANNSYPIPRDVLARANFLFPWMSQGEERRQYIIDEMRAAADRERGGSYSVHISR